MLSLQGVGYRYPLVDTEAVRGVDLTVDAGERVLLCGRSGCGKSTLLRLASGLLGRHGRGAVQGVVRLDDRDPAALAPRDRAALLGFVGQDPADQLVAGTVADEVAFAPEGQAVSPERIAELVAASLDRVGLDVALDRDPRTLSGGQQQRLAVAAALAGGGRLLLLDEPLARLDPAGADRLLEVLRGLSAEGVTVVMAEHRLGRCLPWASRVVAMDGGRVVVDGEPDAVGGALDALGLVAPAPRRELGPVGEVVLERASVTVRYGERVAVDGLAVRVARGERLALVGPNGSGKSSLIGALAGRLAEPEPGVRIVEVPQDPDLALFSDTVRAELAYGPTEQRLEPGVVAARVDAVAGPLGLVPLLDRPPQALSSGERLRVAVGAALTCAPDVLLLDEPTAGQDAGSVEGLLEAVRVAAPDAAVIFATHDLDLAAREAHRTTALEPVAPPVVEAKRATWSGGLDPRTRLALLAAVGVLAVVLDRPVTLAALAAVTGGVLLAMPIGWTWRRRALGISLALVWSTALSQGLFYGEVPRSPLVSVGPLVIWREGLWHGLAQSLRMLAAAYGGVALALSTPTDRLVAALAALRLPWSVGLLAAVALRVVPEVAGEWAAVRAARAARGRELLARTPTAWLALETRLLRPVAARALRRSRALALSLDARGFDPDARRTLARPLRLGAGDAAVLVPVLATTLGVIGLELLYRAYLAEVLYLPALRPVYGWVRAWL